jgi:precorrin-6Y C5,15-methyltransferase (decarboxylating)
MLAEPPPDTAAPWLSIVGLGADGVRGLAETARAAIAQAELVAGSARQLQLVQALVTRETLVWPSPLADGIAKILDRRGRSTCVLASGDPFWFGIGATLALRVPPHELACFPAASSMSLAAARLGWPLQDVQVVSLHGRDLQLIIAHLAPARRLIVLSWDAHTPGKLSELLCQRGFGASRMHVLEMLGGASERVRSCSAADFALRDVTDLNLVALELRAEARALYMPSRGSLPDSAFEHDGQITKQDIRALTLSALAPYPGARLWDVGAGSGSIAIEWMLSHPSCSAHAIERDPERCARIRKNASALGVPGLELVEATAPAGLERLPTPDAIFIGGGVGDAAIFQACWAALRSGGRLVINAVTLQSEGLLTQWHHAHRGELRRFSIEHAEPLGSLTGWRPARPVTQWRVQKP